MLEVRVHCPGAGSYHPANGDRSIHLSPGDILPAGEHGLVKLIALPADVDEIIGQETRRQGRGQLLVSGESSG